MIIYIYIGIYLTPILAIIFCVNLIAIIKKVKDDEPTSFNSFLLTFSFVLIVWSIAIMAVYN